MSMEAFLEVAKRRHGELAVDGMHRVTRYHVVEGHRQYFVKEVRELFTDDGNKEIDVRLAKLDCGCSGDDPKQVVTFNGNLYCAKCIRRCPSCNEWILPDSGEQVGDTWYHSSCAVKPKQHFELRRLLDEAITAEKLESDQLRNRLAREQIETARVQREHTEAQTEALERRLDLEESQAYHRISLEDHAQHQRDRVIDSQLENETANRGVTLGRFRIEAMERIKKLEADGLLPNGESNRLLR